MIIVFWLIIVVLIAIIFYIECSKQVPFERKISITEQLSEENRKKNARNFSFENQMDSDASYQVTYIDEGREIFTQESFTPANSVSLSVFFHTKILRVIFRGQVLDIDISDADKEYHVIITPDGSINTCTC